MLTDAAGCDRTEGPASPRRVAFYTLGCKLNQCETAGLRTQFASPGYAIVDFSELADIYVINTCSVTGRADAQARQLVRRIVRERPGAAVVVTGCYAQRAPRELAVLPGVTLVAGNGEKERLRRLIEALPARAPGEAAVEVADLRKARRSFEMAPVEFGERSRAYLRIQDGCDAGCTFCIIPRLRGRSTSLPLEEASRRVAQIIAAGYREVILTGIHLGMFGHDRGEPGALARLIDRLEELPGQFRLRLSSIEPQEIDDALIDRIAAGGRLVPHLHVPLQSGSDRTLAAMNRTYRSADYRDVVERLVRRVAPLGLGADVIAGFPGENEADFEATERFIASLPFTYLHVFPFSPRPGTRAASLGDRPAAPVVEERAARLRTLSAEKAAAFRRRLTGRTAQVVAEEPGEEPFWEGWSEHYVRVEFPWAGPEDLGGRIVAVGELAPAGPRMRGVPQGA